MGLTQEIDVQARGDGEYHRSNLGHDRDPRCGVGEGHDDRSGQRPAWSFVTGVDGVAHDHCVVGDFFHAEGIGIGKRADEDRLQFIDAQQRHAAYAILRN